MNRRVEWAAKLADVQEVSVLGVADLVYWRQWLRQSDLIPLEHDGKAQVMIIAASARIASVRFRELSFSVSVSPPERLASDNAACLVQAYNSCRLFAFCERAFFSTPYDHGNVRLAASLPAVVELAKGRKVVFWAQMQAAKAGQSRAPSCSREDGWEGAVLLPDQRKQRAAGRKLFFARIQGYTCRYPFLPDRDSFSIEPSPAAPVFQALVDSHFVPTEWVLREKASHSKSRTYKCRRQ